MALYAMGDFHLSFSSDKPMDVFGPVWTDHTEKIRSLWPLGPEDTILIAGDVSWAMKLEDVAADFAFLQSLPGKKILLRGNHDYWWNTLAKLRRFSVDYPSVDFLFNNSFEYGDFSLCGSRGWMSDQGEDAKIMARELGRLKRSLDSATRPPICFLHYPPLFNGQRYGGFIDAMKEAGVTECYYGHLHGSSHRFAVEGETDGITYRLISADYLGFRPLKICD